VIDLAGSGWTPPCRVDPPVRDEADRLTYASVDEWVSARNRILGLSDDGAKPEGIPRVDTTPAIGTVGRHILWHDLYGLCGGRLHYPGIRRDFASDRPGPPARSARDARERRPRPRGYGLADRGLGLHRGRLRARDRSALRAGDRAGHRARRAGTCWPASPPRSSRPSGGGRRRTRCGRRCGPAATARATSATSPSSSSVDGEHSHEERAPLAVAPVADPPASRRPARGRQRARGQDLRHPLMASLSHRQPSGPALHWKPDTGKSTWGAMRPAAAASAGEVTHCARSVGSSNNNLPGTLALLRRPSVARR
jgi:hypothetical protein